MFINDWHYVLTFGKYKGKRLMDVSNDYRQKIKNYGQGPAFEALVRISQRRGVTKIIKKMPLDDYIPPMIELKDIPKIQRVEDLDPALFGSFVEYFVKHHFGLTKKDQVKELLAFYGLAELPSHLTFEGGGKFLKPTKRVNYILESFNRKAPTPADICNLSFSHQLLIDLNRGNRNKKGKFDDSKASHLYTYVKQNELYFNKYIATLIHEASIPKFLDADQDTCDKISVGCVHGEIDAIVFNKGDPETRIIVDIKCRAEDDLGYFRKQLFAYAYLHSLRYPALKIHKCQIYNFLTGKIWSMNVSKVPLEIMKAHIEKMGSHCEFHKKLFYPYN